MDNSARKAIRMIFDLEDHYFDLVIDELEKQGKSREWVNQIKSAFIEFRLCEETILKEQGDVSIKEVAKVIPHNLWLEIMIDLFKSGND